MLAPDTRQTLVDALRPPPGYRLGAAVGTTYSLDLDVAFTPALAFALHRVAASGDPQEIEPIELLDSIRRHADRYTLFFQAGQVQVPLQRRLFAFLEGGVVPVTAPRGGVFHPKVWALRFEAEDGPPLFRALCASRNLTCDRAWDTLVRLDGDLGDGGGDGGDLRGEALAELIRALPDLAVVDLSPTRRRAIEELASQLAEVRWELPPGATAGTLHALGLRPGPAPASLAAPAGVRQLAVISPFLSGELLRRLPHAASRRALISRPDQIAACADAVRERFNEVYTLDTDAVSPSGAGGFDGSGRSLEDPAVPFDGLHAKVFVFDCDDHSRVWTGSANATLAAFERNVEFVTELIGPTAAFGVDALLAEPTGDVQTLRSFLTPCPVEAAADEEAAPSALEDLLDRARRSLASAPLNVRATAVDGGAGADRYRLSFTSEADPPPLPPGLGWRCWPISLHDAASIQVPPGEPLSVEFTVSLEAVTVFLASEVSAEGRSTRFVLVGRLAEEIPDRHARLLRGLLGDAERFLRYLLMLLHDPRREDVGLETLLDTFDRVGPARPASALDTAPLLEAMLRTLASEPARLADVDQLLRELSRSGGAEADPLVPPGLLEVWAPIWAVARELGS